MKPEDIHLFDWFRLFIGNIPLIFFLEVVIRVLFVFFLLVVALRFLGKRMASLMDLHEFTALTSLAAAIGIPIQSPDRGLLPALVIAITVVTLQKLIFYFGLKNKKIELLVHGDTSILVSNGVMNLTAMKKVRITRERLFAQLRSESIISMGEVRRLYIEANGEFTLLKQPKAGPGLLLIPESDSYSSEFQKAEDQYSCTRCGNVWEGGQESQTKCANCKHNSWSPAVLVPEMDT